MSSELQRIVDSLGRSTQRAVAICDRKGLILAYSSHSGEVDEVRAASILTRRTPAAAFAWSKAFGIEKAAAPVRVPANEELKMLPRVCAPVRFEGALLAYLWLVDDDGLLADNELETVQAAADAAGLALHREQLMEELERGRERELLRDLLADDPAVRAHAADELAERKFVDPNERVVAVVVRPVRDRAPMTRRDTGVRAAVEKCLAQGRAAFRAHAALPLVRQDHGLLVVSLSQSASAPDALLAAGAVVHAAISASLTSHSGWRAVVGIGDVQQDLVEAHASYRRARQAAEVAGLLESFDPVTGWWQLGVYQTLLDLPLEHLTENSLPAGLVRLMATRDASVWMQTLETYFDVGCDARAAAKVLGVQRGSLYHRLNRIEELAAVDLGRGDDRLALHLGLKLARLTGLFNR